MDKVELGKQFVKVTISVVTMMILLLATQKMQLLTDCIVKNMKNEHGHRSSEPLVAPNCKELLINETMPAILVQICDRDVSLYVDSVLLERFMNVKEWLWPLPGKCLRNPSDTYMCKSRNGTNIIVNGISLSVYESKMLSTFVDAHMG